MTNMRAEKFKFPAPYHCRLPLTANSRYKKLRPNNLLINV
jgi:hypothetical protein